MIHDIQKKVVISPLVISDSRIPFHELFKILEEIKRSRALSRRYIIDCLKTYDSVVYIGPGKLLKEKRHLVNMTFPLPFQL